MNRQPTSTPPATSPSPSPALPTYVAVHSTHTHLHTSCLLSFPHAEPLLQCWALLQCVWDLGAWTTLPGLSQSGEVCVCELASVIPWANLQGGGGGTVRYGCYYYVNSWSPHKHRGIDCLLLTNKQVCDYIHCSNTLWGEEGWEPKRPSSLGLYYIHQLSIPPGGL